MAQQIFEEIFASQAAETDPAMKGRQTVAMSFEEQVHAQMNRLREQEKTAAERREEDKKRMQQSLQEKLRARSEMKKDKGKKSAEVKKQQSTSHKVPSPATMPATKKQFLYSKENIELFRDLEKYAVTHEVIARAGLSFDHLMERLMIAQLSDLEKVRILFHWITAQNLNSLDYGGQIEEDSPLGFFLAIKNDQKTYASLFERLCRAADVQAKTVTGFLKGAGYFPDYKFTDKTDPFRGSWNAVLLNGQWRLIDTNWGSRHVTEEGTKPDVSGSPEYKYEEHYFLTDPDQLINTHYPDELSWQLMKKTISLSDFEKTPKIWPLFYKLRLELRSHKEGLITVDETGFVKIQLTVSAFARTDAKLKAELRPRDQSALSASVIKQLQQHLFHHNDEDLETFEVFLPQEGNFLLKIFGQSKHFGESNVFVNVCLYQLNCPTITSTPKSKVVPPIPVVNLFYGPNIAYSHMIARPISHPGPIVECTSKGEAKVVMNITAADSNVAIAHDLFNASVSQKAVRHRVIQSYEKTALGIELTLHIRVPQNGNYALAIYSNIENIGSGTFQPFCYYLVSSKDQCDVMDSFPVVPNDVIGAIYPAFSELSLTIEGCLPSKMIDWKHGMVKTDDDGEVMLFLGHEKPLTVLADFSSTADSQSLNKFLCVSTIGKTTCIVARTSSKDYGIVPYLIKVYAADVGVTQQIPSVYTVIVIPHSANITAEEFFESPSRAWGPIGTNYFKHDITGISFLHSISHIKSKCPLPDFISSDCVRVYKGGDDFEFTLNHVHPLQLKTTLQQIDQTNATAEQQPLDNLMCMYKADAKSSSLKIRVPQTGTYTLSVFGSHVDNASGQLSPLIYISIIANKSSSETSPFPTAFGVWAASARLLHQPFSSSLLRNKENTVKLYLAKFEKPYKKSEEWKIVPYPAVAFVADGTVQIQPKSVIDDVYEWKYAPGPAEKVAGILVKADPTSKSMAYALQFQIE